MASSGGGGGGMGRGSYETARFWSPRFVCRGFDRSMYVSSYSNFLLGYLALSVGVAGSDRQATVGAVWVGRWESSKPRLLDRRAFVTRVGREGERIFSFGGGGRA
jgi:hypothetical protein